MRHKRGMEQGGWVYLMANRYRGGLYVGVTADLTRRVWQHRNGEGSRHVAAFDKTRLVYAERHDRIEDAIAREKLVKKWRREWKFALIEADNPDWLDLWDQWHPVMGTDGEEGQPGPVSSTGRREGE
ncbi:MAG: GIY-YIG nuclease family protein [Sphingomonadales bacterium]|nr:GIY-YIG nuclease family protein [Sphingomonadales bacterium]